MPRSTDTLATGAREGPRGEAWALAVALDCERLDAPPARLALAGVTEVEIGHGPQRQVRRDGHKVRIDLADRWASGVHARFVAAGEGWEVSDAGSKNGTMRNGKRVARERLEDGDVIECGATFMVLRRAAAPIGDLDAPVAGPSALRTLSPALERELAMLPKIARSRVPVLVRGESGTGKEMVAAAVHALSGRRGPLVSVNCGALPESLIESELFGSKRGAFSGAQDKPGLVRNAENGTLFLDEIAELKEASQAALLRVLQDGEVLPLGAGKSTMVDVRVVAATNRPIEELVVEGRFRRDLHARLRGYEVRLPPLRARLEDLGILVAAILLRLEPDGPGARRRLSRGAARALFLHPWSYQVRELEQALHAAIAVAGNAEIRLEHLALQTSSPASPRPPDDGRARLVELLHKHEGNANAVARDLATSRTQVLRLLGRYGLTAGAFKRR